jgi:predicted dehydrogenase
MLNEVKHLHGIALISGEMLHFVQHDMVFRVFLSQCICRVIIGATNTMTQLKVGIIGAGAIARGRHIPCFQRNEKAALVAIADVVEGAAERVAREFGIPAFYTSYQEMIDQEGLDAVVICTPNKFHAPVTIDALGHGLHVLCEKPMALNAEEGRTMLQAAQDAGKIFSVAFHYRHKPNARAAKQIIEDGELGDIYMVRVQALRRRGIPSWGTFTNKEIQGGGAMVDFGVHLLDLALWLMGSPRVQEVTAVTSQRIGTRPNVNAWGPWNYQDFQVEDHAAAFLRLPGGKAIQMEVSWALNIAESAENVSLSGTEAGLDVFPLRINKPAHGMLINSTPAWMPGEKDSEGDLQTADFVDAVLENRRPIVTGAQALQVSEIVDAIYRSSISGAAVRLD